MTMIHVVGFHHNTPCSIVNFLWFLVDSNKWFSGKKSTFSQSVSFRICLAIQLINPSFEHAISKVINWESLMKKDRDRSSSFMSSSPAILADEKIKHMSCHELQAFFRVFQNCRINGRITDLMKDTDPILLHHILWHKEIFMTRKCLSLFINTPTAATQRISWSKMSKRGKYCNGIDEILRYFKVEMKKKIANCIALWQSCKTEHMTKSRPKCAFCL